MITFDHVSKQYPDGTVAVDDLTLEVPSGDVMVLLGPSGCGKTTSLRMVNRLIEPSNGTITINGRDVRDVPAHELRRSIGYVIQAGGLFPHRTVVDNIGTVPELLGWDTGRRRARSHELMDLVGLDRAVADRFPAELSGGQQQRVGVARALAADPPVLLMDEPFGALDPVLRAELQVEFRRLQQSLGTTVILVTHDVNEAVTLADHVAVLRSGGRLAQSGPVQEVLAYPGNDFVTAFLGDGRGQQLLSLQPAILVPSQPLPELGVAGWTLELDETGAPRRWTPHHGPVRVQPVAVQAVGPTGSLRQLLDSALASPARCAVRVTSTGVLDGIIPWPVLQHHLAAPLTGGLEMADPQRDGERDVVSVGAPARVPPEDEQ